MARKRKKKKAGNDRKKFLWERRNGRVRSEPWSWERRNKKKKKKGRGRRREIRRRKRKKEEKEKEEIVIEIDWKKGGGTGGDAMGGIIYENDGSGGLKL